MAAPFWSASVGSRRSARDFAPISVRECVADHPVRVIIARSAAGHDYLKTEADGYRPDNGLRLGVAVGAAHLGDRFGQAHPASECVAARSMGEYRVHFLGNATPLDYSPSPSGVPRTDGPIILPVTRGHT